jgi:4-hydroxy-2-oxoheptanedioate aldolase
MRSCSARGARYVFHLAAVPNQTRLTNRSFENRSRMTEDRFRRAAREGQVLFNAWLTLNLPVLIDLIGEAGWDSILIDQQHGLGGHDEMVECLTAAKAAGIPALVRVADNDPGLVGRVLDAGAQGVICPLINSVDDAERFVRAVKYPPRGSRSWGPYRAQLNVAKDYVTCANGWTIACPQIETRGALDQLDDILSIDGVDMVCFGPNDLSAALTGRFDIRASEVLEAMTLVLRKCREASVMAFIFANDVEYAKPLIDAGWNMVAIGTDMDWFFTAASEIRRELIE